MKPPLAVTDTLYPSLSTAEDPGGVPELRVR
jgi:hypothetical protein